MLFSTPLFTFLLALLPLTTPLALPSAYKTFQLRVPADGPADLAGQYVTKNSSSETGRWYPSFGDFPLHLRIKPNNGTITKRSDALRGEVVDAAVMNGTVARMLWLENTFTTPMYAVRLGGNPLTDAEVPRLAVYNEWTINEGRCASPNSPSCPERAGRWTLDFGPYASWVGCTSGDGHYSLNYYGTRRGCTEMFDLEVEWDFQTSHA